MQNMPDFSIEMPQCVPSFKINLQKNLIDLEPQTLALASSSLLQEIDKLEPKPNGYRLSLDVQSGLLELKILSIYWYQLVLKKNNSGNSGEA